MVTSSLKSATLTRMSQAALEKRKTTKQKQTNTKTSEMEDKRKDNNLSVVALKSSRAPAVFSITSLQACLHTTPL